MKKEIIREIKEHIPFTFFATLSAIILTAIIFFGMKIQNLQSTFEVIHPIHLFVSAIVTAGIYYKYKNNFIEALGIGIIGSILIGSLSDIILPYLGGNLLSLNTNFHLPILEIPFVIIITAIIGSIVGIKTGITHFPHFFHVFLSVFASLFYLIAFSSTLSLTYLAISTIIIFIAVLIPCCISDIIFPLIFVKGKCCKK
ncbi:hypothetical protein HOD88_00370 [archaeon]|mgnify:CR=1 FL=1|jgi:hypothetical protein|nr:hypothetical protein [archaeon]